MDVALFPGPPVQKTRLGSRLKGATGMGRGWEKIQTIKFNTNTKDLFILFTDFLAGISFKR